MSDEFDIDAGVADIAESMGFNEAEEVNEPIEEPVEEIIEEPVKEEQEEVIPETKQAPSSWAKEQHEVWAKLPPEAQNYIELREKQMLDGIEQYKDGFRYANELNGVIEQYRDDIKEFGIPDSEVVYNLLSHHRAITKGTLEERQQAFLHIGYQTGLIPQDKEVDPQYTQLQERLNRIENQEKRRQQEINEREFNNVKRQVEEFASDPKNKYFDELGEDIAIMLKAGIDLQSAYERAVWANPVTRAKEMAAQTQAQSEAKKKEAEAAKKASSVNINRARTDKESVSPLGSWDETMQGVINKMRTS